MASWIEELFPPKFKVDDLFDNDYRKTTSSQSNDNFRKIYEDVFKEMQFKERGEKGFLETRQLHGLDAVDGQGQELGMRKQDCTKSLAGPKITAQLVHVDNSKSVQTENTHKGTGDECLWSAHELHVLRKSLKCSKLNNIRLNVLTRALQKDCERVRNTCQEQASEILKLDRKYNEVRKQNKAMKITCKAFKEDSKNAQENLKDCRSRLEVATEAKNAVEIELVTVKRELESVQKRNKILQLECNKQQLLQEKLLENQNVSLRSMYEKEIIDLLQRLERTEQSLEKERNEHTIARKALAHLRLHFAGDEY